MYAITTLFEGRTAAYGLSPEIKPDTGYHTAMVECGRRGDRAKALEIIKAGGDIADLTQAYAHGVRLGGGIYEGQ
jgi:hypothetical protein